MSDRFERYIQGAPPLLAPSLSQDIARVLNKHSAETASGTPDIVLAEFLESVLKAWDEAMINRSKWRNESVELPALQQIEKGKRTVPMVVYSGNMKMRNDIGEAEIVVTPGEAIPVGKVVRVIAVLEEDLE